MIKRNAADLLKKLAVGFPVVSIIEPRQSGKTTLAQHCFAEKPYVTLEDPDTRDFALHDPRSFWRNFLMVRFCMKCNVAPICFLTCKASLTVMDAWAYLSWQVRNSSV